MPDKKPSSIAPSVLGYSDYRAYLRDIISYRKSLGRPASNRWFAQAVGINSSSWLSVILSGKKGLSTTTAAAISKALKHNREEKYYFETLVLFNQAKTLEEQNRYFNEIIELRKGALIKWLDESQHQFYTTWIHSVVWSLIDLYTFDGNEQDFANMIQPTVTSREVRESVEVLERLGLVEKNQKGIYRSTNKLISSGNRIRKVSIAHFQQETMKLAWEAIDRFPREQRDISTLTLGISESSFKKIQDMASSFRKQVLLLAQEDKKADRVYQCNLQLFPMALPTGKVRPGNE